MGKNGRIKFPKKEKGKLREKTTVTTKKEDETAREHNRRETTGCDHR